MTAPMMSSSTLSARSHELPNLAPQSRYLCFGPFHIDLKREELFKDRARVRIPSKVYQVLVALLDKPGEVVTREDLRARLWPAGTFVNYDANVNTTVNKLRLALGDEPDTPQYVETIPRQGYCFVGRVERRNELANATLAIPSAETAENISEPLAAAPSAAESIAGRLPGFLLSGWAAAVLLCGVLIGMGIVLYTHRPL
jgi:DNA-binding winged helix-turn-helix (wHTH) protein